MKVSLIGAGKWGGNILRTLHELGSLGAVCEGSTQRREELNAQYPDVQFVDSPEEAIDAGDAVAIATPAESHAPLALQAMDAGKHAFVEKPMALSIEEAERLVAKADETGKVCMAGHLLLYQPAVAFLKKSLDEGLIGNVYTLHHERLNHGRARDVENVLWSLGVHDLAVCLYLTGQAPSEVNFSGHAGINPGIEDDTRLDLGFPDGVRAHIHNSWLWPTLHRELTIVGSQGMLVYNEVAQVVSLYRKTIDADLTMHGKDSDPEVVYEGAGQPLTLEMEHFITCCKTGETPRSDARHALDVTRVMERACPVAVTA